MRRHMRFCVYVCVCVCLARYQTASRVDWQECLFCFLKQTLKADEWYQTARLTGTGLNEKAWGSPFLTLALSLSLNRARPSDSYFMVKTWKLWITSAGAQRLKVHRGDESKEGMGVNERQSTAQNVNGEERMGGGGGGGGDSEGREREKRGKEVEIKSSHKVTLLLCH